MNLTQDQLIALRNSTKYIRAQIEVSQHFDQFKKYEGGKALDEFAEMLFAELLTLELSKDTNSDTEPVGYVTKLPVTNPQSIRPDANEAFTIPVYCASHSKAEQDEELEKIIYTLKINVIAHTDYESLKYATEQTIQAITKGINNHGY